MDDVPVHRVLEWEEAEYPHVIAEPPIVCPVRAAGRRLGTARGVLLALRSKRILPVNEEMAVKHYSKPLEDPKECCRRQEHRSKSLNRGAKDRVKMTKQVKQHNLGTELLPPIKFVLLQHMLESKRP